MSLSLSPILNGFQCFLASGLPNNGGFIYTYLAGTTTPAATYTTNAGTIPNSNPIVLTADGRPPQQIWITDGSAYKFIIYDSSLNLIPSASYDNIIGIGIYSQPSAAATTSGYLLSSDWTTFNSKQAALGYIPLKTVPTRDNTSDINTFAGSSGVFAMGSGNTNSPGGAGYGNLLQINNADVNTQFYFAQNGNSYWRGASGSTLVGVAWKTVWDSVSLTNLNQLTNGPGYITSTGTAAAASSLNSAAATYLTGNVIGSYIATNYNVTPNGLGYPGLWTQYNQTQSTNQNTIYGWIRTA